MDSCYALSCDLNISGWFDTSVGGLSVEQAFGGHFNGNGYTVTYRIAEGNNAGLFPYLVGSAQSRAAVINLQCRVTQETYQDAGNAVVPTGALSRHAQNADIIGVSVEQTMDGDALTQAAGVVYEVLDNASVTDCSVTMLAPAAGSADHYGGICYRNYGTVSDCNVTKAGSTLGVTMFGGLVAENYGSVTGCSSHFGENSLTGIPAQSAESGSAYIGGIVGYQYSGSVTDCTSTFNFTSAVPASRVGGIVGQAESGRFENCRSFGSQIFSNSMLGGFAGCILIPAGGDITVENCESAVARINGAAAEVGGLAGAVRVAGNLVMRGSTANTDVTGARHVGGILGAIEYTDDGSIDEPASVTVENCHSTAGSVEATASGAPSEAGGAIGIVTGDAAFAYTALTVRNCTAWANVTSGGSNAGGFIGGQYESDAIRSAGYTYENCVAYGDAAARGGAGTVDQNNDSVGNVGGFVGYVATMARNISFYSCISYGSANGTLGTPVHHVGGFGGDVRGESCLIEQCKAFGKATARSGAAGFIGRAEGVTVRNSSATGDAYVSAGEWAVGGFIGFTGYSENSSGSVFSFCTASGDAGSIEDGTITESGGFVATARSGRFDHCTAYGNVRGAYNLGGFAGKADGAAISFTDCETFGEVTAAGTVGEERAGGFAGYVVSAGTLRFTDCIAHGNVLGSNGGGFAGRLTGGHVEFDSCTAFGNVTGRGGDGNYGGFIGWSTNTTTRAVNCLAYGSVTGADATVRNCDAGGFFGPNGARVTAENCHAYGAVIVANPTLTAGFMCLWRGSNESTFTNCTYNPTAANLGFFQSNTSWGGVDISTVTDTNCTTNGGSNDGDSSKPSLGFSVTDSEGSLELAFFDFTSLPAGSRINEIEVSADAGRSFTQLVHNGITLTVSEVNGAQVSAGSSISLSPSSRVNFLYSYRNSYPAGNICVRIVLNGGYTKTFKG